MKSIVTSDEMKKIEKCAIDDIGINSLVLMERAALSVVSHIKKRATKQDKICLICGSGNNGADGVAIARMLLEDNYKVSIVVLEKAQSKYTQEMKIQLDILDKMGISYQHTLPNIEFDYFVDAIFGIGLKREITDKKFLDIIDAINKSNAYIYSVDIPSGIDSTLGKVMGNAIKANETITFAYKKMGLMLHPGKKYAGKVICENIGIPSVCIDKYPVNHYTYEEYGEGELLKRDADGNKGTFGKVAIIAGSKEISGASLLCAGTSLTSGVGMIKVLSQDKTLDVIRMTLPEAMVQPIDDLETMEYHIKVAIDWADVIVIGPGIGMDKDAYFKMKYTLQNMTENKRLIIDADGINLISKYTELRELTREVNSIIYTPHMKELQRLIGGDIEDLKQDLDKVMEGVLSDSNAIYVCKDSVTRVYQKNKPVFISSYGNSGMATAGSGDVLAGLLGAILAKKDVDMYKGCILAVHLHSLAGDFAAKEYGKIGMTASNIAEALSNVLITMEEFFDV